MSDDIKINVVGEDGFKMPQSIFCIEEDGTISIHYSVLLDILNCLELEKSPRDVHDLIWEKRNAESRERLKSIKTDLNKFKQENESGDE